MAIEDIIYSAMTGGRTRRAENLADQVEALKQKHGSVRAAARAAGIPPTSFRRMLQTGRAKEANTGKVVQSVRAERLASDIPTDQSLVIKAKDRQGGVRGRERKLTAEKLQLRAGTMDKVREAYLRGDDVGAAKALLAGIGNKWYRDWLTPGSLAAKTGTVDGSGGGPEGAKNRASQGSSGGSGGSSAGGSGGGSDGGDDWDDWEDLTYEGGDELDDSDYGASIGGIS